MVLKDSSGYCMYVGWVDIDSQNGMRVGKDASSVLWREQMSGYFSEAALLLLDGRRLGYHLCYSVMRIRAKD